MAVSKRAKKLIPIAAELAVLLLTLVAVVYASFNMSSAWFASTDGNARGNGGQVTLVGDEGAVYTIYEGTYENNAWTWTPLNLRNGTPDMSVGIDITDFVPNETRYYKLVPEDAVSDMDIRITTDSASLTQEIEGADMTVSLYDYIYAETSAAEPANGDYKPPVTAALSSLKNGNMLEFPSFNQATVCYFTVHFDKRICNCFALDYGFTGEIILG